jgi:hypothetical protein
MTADYALNELKDLIPQLSSIGRYNSEDGLNWIKENIVPSKNHEMSDLFTTILKKNKEVSSLRIDQGSRSGFFYFQKVSNQTWIFLSSDQPVFGLVNLFLKQKEIEWEESSQKIPTGSPNIEEEHYDLLSTKRMQKQIHRQIKWLSNKVAQKAIYHIPSQVVSGCTYTFKNFTDSIILAIADTNMTGTDGALVTFSIQSLFSEFLSEELTDISQVVDKISKGAHSHNLKVSTKEDYDNLKPVHVGILKLDFKNNLLHYASNGLPFICTSDRGIAWHGTQQELKIENYQVDMNLLGPIALMNQTVLKVFGQKGIENIFQSDLLKINFSSHHLTSLLSEQKSHLNDPQDQLLIAVNEYAQSLSLT